MNRREGFTLIEVIIALTLLVIILVTSYQIFSNVLIAEREVHRLSIPEKVGEGVLALFRRDLAGAFYKGSTESLANEVFMGLSADSSDGPDDRIFFLTSVDPKARPEYGEWESIRTVCVVGYFLQPNEASSEFQTYTLFRKEITEFDERGVLDAPGINYAVYDKVKSMDIWYFNGYRWQEEWTSAGEIADQEQRALALQDEENRQPGRLPRVSDPAGTTGAAGEEGEENLYTDPYDEPGAPIPLAVRIDLEVYAAIGNEVHTQRSGEPIVKRFTTIVPLLAAKRLPIEIEALDEAGADGMAGGAGAAGGPGDATTTAFGTNADGPGRGGRDGRGGREGRGDGRGAGGRDLRRFLRGGGAEGGRLGFGSGRNLGGRAMEALRSSGGGGRGGGGVPGGSPR